VTDSQAPESRVAAAIPKLPRSGVWSWLPGLWTLRHYQQRWLARDVVAGLVLTALLVPAGMGYAEAAGLPAVTGIYATILPLLAYAVVGPSRILVYGPDSSLAALIAVAVVGRAGDDPARAIALASVLAILTGALCIVAGIARAGFVADLLSKPVRVGYMNGIALTVIVTQLPKLFGFKVSATSVPSGALHFVQGVIERRTNGIALAIGATSLALIVLGRMVWKRIPWVLVAVAGATLVVGAFALESQLDVVGDVPRGLPLPSVPSITSADIGPLAMAAFGIAVVSFADTSVLSRSVAGRLGERVDANRELFALGVANLAAGFFQGFPISSSSSRTPVAESAGSRTQLTGVVAAIALVVVLLFAPSLLSHLPTAALAAVVIGAAVRIFDFEAVRVFFRVRRSDFVLSLVAFLAVAVLGVIPGIAGAVGLSLLDVVRRAWRPHHAVLGRADGVKGYHDVTRFDSARQVPGLLLFRWDAPLFFANADLFRHRILELVESATVPVLWVVVAAEPITDVDTTAAEMLEELDKELAQLGAELAFAEMKDPVKDRLERYGLQARIGRDFFFPTLGSAVRRYREGHPGDFRDWEEEG